MEISQIQPSCHVYRDTPPPLSPPPPSISKVKRRRLDGKHRDPAWHAHAPEQAEQEEVIVPVAPAGSSGESIAPSMPALIAASPCEYRGCKIYTSLKTSVWRVVPFPRQSVYDKKFHWGAEPARAWAALVAYCEAPTLPESRKGDLVAK